MDANDGFDGKPTNLNCFYIHTIFEQKYLKPAIVTYTRGCQLGDIFSKGNFTIHLKNSCST